VPSVAESCSTCGLWGVGEGCPRKQSARREEAEASGESESHPMSWKEREREGRGLEITGYVRY